MQPHLWIRQGTEVQGPFSVDRVRRWIAEGRVRRDMQFSADGGATWLSGDDCPELFAPAPPPLPKPPPAVRGSGPPRRGPRRTRARPPARERPRKWVWVVLVLGVLWIAGTATKGGRSEDGSASSSSKPSMPVSSFRGRRVAIYEHNFTYLRGPAGMDGDLLPAVAVEPRIVGDWNTLAALVRKVRRTPEVRQRHVHFVCFQWHARLERDRFGNKRGYGPAFWVILDVATIRRIGNPGAVAKHDWLGHYVASGSGQWR